jgi:hypothetical protein
VRAKEVASWERMKERRRCSVAEAERVKTTWVSENGREVGRPKMRGPKRPARTDGVCRKR